MKPFVASRYPVDPKDQTLVGASLGGLFALHTMLTAPRAFQRYVAISPAIYWGDGKLFDLEADLAAKAQDLPVHLYLAAGGLEEGHDARQKFVSNLYALEARLRARAYPGLDMSLRVFEGETHMSVYFGALARGLGAVSAATATCTTGRGGCGQPEHASETAPPPNMLAFETRRRAMTTLSD